MEKQDNFCCLFGSIIPTNTRIISLYNLYYLYQHLLNIMEGQNMNQIY